MRVAHGTTTPRSAGMLALALGLLPCVASPQPLQLPTSSLHQYYSEQHAMRTESSEALARALLHLAERAPEDRRFELVDQAARIAPSLPEPHLMRTSILLRRFDIPGAALSLRSAFEAARHDARQTATWSLQLQGFLHRTLFAALLVLALLLLLRALPFLAHRLGTWTRAPYAVVLVLCSMLLFGLCTAPVGATLVVLLLLAPLLLRSESVLLALVCLVLAVAAFLLTRQSADVLLADPGHPVALLARANRETVSFDDMRRLENEIAPGAERDLVLGLQAARRRQWSQAHRWFVDSQARDSTWATAYVNLANLFFALGDHERAATGYRAAQTFAPDDPIPHANLAQAYIQMLQYEQSDHELGMASSLGFKATSTARMAWTHEEDPLVDAVLSPAELRRVAWGMAAADLGQTRRALQAWRGPGWDLLPLSWTPWILGGVALILLLPLRLQALAFECADCRRITCGHCVTADDSGRLTCPRCDMLASRRAGASVSDGTPASRRPRRVHRPDRGPRGLAVVFPGAAYVILRSPFAAVLTVGLACAVWGLGTSPATAATLFLLLYLPGLLRLRNAATGPEV